MHFISVIWMSLSIFKSESAVSLWTGSRSDHTYIAMCKILPLSETH